MTKPASIAVELRDRLNAAVLSDVLDAMGKFDRDERATGREVHIHQGAWL